MLELKNVSKFYSNKKMVSIGFNKVSLKFDIGEFIAITGESGSGKSTLLNVISGLDSYEEGEMLINGNETSHYSEKDYELYRRKYVGNIFQNFNLINSYTVYQNIELVYLLNGESKKDVKNKVLDLIEKVDLKKYKNTKVSKLSGGQKQRVGIARALALNTPIVLADEPTGNLDKKSSESILELLYNISKDKLVIVVTHNYDQVSKYVTRKITMHDGRVLSDTKIKDYEKADQINENKVNGVNLFNKIRLGIRNAFNIPSKFLILAAVYLFMVFSIFFVYSAFKDLNYSSSNEGYNMYINNVSDKRIIINKKDLTSISDEDFDKINKLNNIDRIVKNDALVDNNISLSTSNGTHYFYGTVEDADSLTKVDMGRLPKKDNEVVITATKDSYLVINEYDEIIKESYLLEEFLGEEFNIVGIKYSKEDEYSTTIYLGDNIIKKISDNINKQNSEISFKIKDYIQTSYVGNKYNEVLPSNKVAKGKIIISHNYDDKCKEYDCTGETVDINIENLYFNDSYKLKVSDVYTYDDIKKVTGYDQSYEGALFINTDLYNSLFNKGFFQSSVYMKDAKNASKTINELKDLGFNTMYTKDMIYNSDSTLTAVINIISLVVILSLIIVLFYVSYFIIKLVLKSRNIYYSTLRILGSSLKTSKSILNIELVTISHLAYIIFGIFIILVKINVINNINLIDLCSYVTIKDYICLYLILLVMSLVLTLRYTRKVFKDSIMNSYKGGSEA